MNVNDQTDFWMRYSSHHVDEKDQHPWLLLIASVCFDLVQQTTLTFWIWTISASATFCLIYYYLVLPVNIVKDLSDVGFDFLTDGTYKSVRFRGKSKRELVNQIQKLRKVGQIPPVYPNGWFALLESNELKKNEVKHVPALGEDFAVFRSSEGKVHILDAYCPHLGANMALGGVVRGDCLQCPFHSWSFNGETGKCFSIPYAEKVPDVAKVKKWPSLEVNDFIFVWYHAEGDEPNWFPEDSEFIKKGQWMYHGRSEFFISSHIEDVPENGADIAHLNAIHKPSLFAGSDLRYYERLIWQFMDHSWSANWEQSSEEKHKGIMELLHNTRVFNKYVLLTMNVKAVQIGPGYVELYMDSGYGRMLLLQTVTPVEPLLQRVVHRIYAPMMLSVFAKFALYGESVMFERDIMVWNHKKYIDRPIIVKEDKTIAKHRRWYSQFYSENSVRFRFSQDGMDW